MKTRDPNALTYLVGLQAILRAGDDDATTQAANEYTGSSTIDYDPEGRVEAVQVNTDEHLIIVTKHSIEVLDLD